MKLRGLQLLPCLLSLASHVSGTVVVQNATYDDRTATPIVETPVGNYKDLNYNAWVIPGPLTPGVQVGGVAAESPPQVALTAVDQQTTNGTPSFTVAKPYKSWSLFDFFFGCNTRTDEPTANVATQCTITVTGFQANDDKEVAIASYTFTPPPNPVTPVSMIHAVLPKTFLQPLYNVTIIQDDTLLALKIDNLHYAVST